MPKLMKCKYITTKALYNIYVIYIFTGHKPLSENIHPWTLTKTLTSCSLEVVNAYHHQDVYASVKCFNQIELHSSISVGPRTVLLQPPSSRDGKVVFVVSNKNPGPSDHSVQVDTKHIQLAWFGLGEEHYTKTFLYHITKRGVPVTEWRNTSQNYAEVDVDLRDGQTYTAEVIAVDVREQSSEPISGSLVIDSRPPVLTGIFNYYIMV